MLLGAHVSIAGGIFNAPGRGEDIGCTAIQIFTKNQKQWKAKELITDDIYKYRQALQQSTIQSVIAHDSYLINLGSPDITALEKSRESFRIEMQRAETLRIPYLVFHPGSHLDSGEKQGLRTIADSLNILLDQHPSYKLILLLENTAGQGSNLGYSFEQLRDIFAMIDQTERAGICFDTAHAFAAGYDLRTKDEYEKTFDNFDQILGLGKLNAFHLNDTPKELGSKIDRHKNIGNGLLGIKPFKMLMNDPRFVNIPKVLETPGTEADFKRNLNLLKSLIDN